MWYWDVENQGEVWMNSKFWKTLGYDPKLMPHKSSAWQKVINADDLKMSSVNLVKHLEDHNHKYEQTVRYKHKEGHNVWILCRGLAIRNDEGKPLRVIGGHIDVTKSKKKEEKLKLLLEVTKDQNDRLKNFAHIVSHNLRSHSSNFEMLLNILFSENPELEKNEILCHLRDSSHNLKETIQHLNEIVTIYTKSSDFSKPIDLKESIDNSLSSFAFLIKSTNTTIENRVHPNSITLGLQSYIDSILHNFISNSLKYRSEDRKNIVIISTEITEEHILLKIEDNGKGIDLERHGEKLYGMYKTFHGNEDAKGIGLFITKNQVEAMGGTIEVKSSVGKGTTFSIYLKKA